ncbi:MAG: IclR family transcriptional regulator domain-containing protein [Streptosporangiaceae bacterium]
MAEIAMPSSGHGRGRLEVSSLAPRGNGLRQTALPFMADLHVATRQHVLLAVRDGSEAVLVERLSARGAAKVLYRVGGRMPLHATGVGLCLLANAPARRPAPGRRRSGRRHRGEGRLRRGSHRPRSQASSRLSYHAVRCPGRWAIHLAPLANRDISCSCHR